MTFTYNPALTDDISLVRFHIGDTHTSGHYLEDETIDYFVSQYSVGKAVIQSIKYIITQLSTPNFRQDWMSVSNEEARKGYERMLIDKAHEFGISLSNVTAVSTISLPYRADSYQDSADSEYDGTP